MFQFDVAGFSRARRGDGDKVKRGFYLELMTPKNLTKPPPNAIPNDGIPDPPRCDKASLQLLTAQKPD